jgi:glycosyltransferase involved in cell wall biosynthesis
MGGSERVTRTLAREAARFGDFEGVDIFVLAWSRTGTLDELERQAGVRLHYALAPNTSRGMLSMVRFLAVRRYAFVFSSATHVNAVCSAMRKLGLLRTGWLVGRESTQAFDRDFGRMGPLSRMLYRLYGAQDVLVCQTERMRQSLARSTRGRFDAKLKVVPNPVDRERIERGRRMPPPPHLAQIPADRMRIVWCGRLSPVKSPLRAIEVVRLLHMSGMNNAHLVVIGDGPLRQDLVTHALNSGVQEFVTFVGHQENPAAAMAGARLGLVTSDVEGFPNVILEMLAAGVGAVVTTDCAGELNRLPCTFVSPSVDAATIAKAAIVALASQDTCNVGQLFAQRSPASSLRSMMDPNHRAAMHAGT